MRRGVQLVALTGASGFVGNALLNSLLEAGYHVRALEHRTKLPAHPLLTIIRGSLDDAPTQRALVEGADVVVHAGGLVLAKRPQDFFIVNTDATIALATAARNADVARFLFVSSLAARAPQLSPYAASKWHAETQLGQVEGLSYDIIRPPAIYGPGDMNSLPLLRMLARGHVWLPVRRDAVISMLHVQDLVAAIVSWLACEPAPTGSIFELADGAGAQRWDALVDAAANALGHPVRLHPIPRGAALGFAHMAQFLARCVGKASFISPGKIREMAHPDWSVNSEAFCSATGWSPNITIYDGLRDSMRWVEKQQNFA